MKNLLLRCVPVCISSRLSKTGAPAAGRLRRALSAHAPDAYAFTWAAVAISLAKLGVLQEILL